MVKYLTIFLCLLSLGVYAEGNPRTDQTIKELKEELEALKSQMKTVEAILDQLEGRESNLRETLSDTEYYRFLRLGLPDLTVSEDEYYRQISREVLKAKSYEEAISLLETYLAYFPTGRYSPLVKNELAWRKLKVKEKKQRSDFEALLKRIESEKSLQRKLQMCQEFIETYDCGPGVIEAYRLKSRLIKEQLRKRNGD